jgi:thiol-disulfide isomerase/thioredoxin
MKKLFFVTIILVIQFDLFAQAPKPKLTITEKTIIKDSSGMIYPTAIWSKLMQSGDYSLRPVDINDPNTDFILFKLTEKEKELRNTTAPKPAETKFFVTGKAFGKLKTTDMYGKSWNLKDLKGKIVVLNFWFINCPPCRAEIPHLNKIVEKYKSESDIVFLAVALDDKSEIESFLKQIPFQYTIIDRGGWLAQGYGIKSFPTNVVLDREGIVRFHATGYSTTLPYWIEKSIEEIKAVNTLQPK